MRTIGGNYNGSRTLPSHTPRRPLSIARRNMRISCVDGMFWAVMVGTGESNLVLFALSLGMSPVIAGLVGTVPPLAGALLQSLTPILVGRLRSHKKLILLCVLVQVLAILPLVMGSLLGYMHLLVLLAAASVYWGAGFAGGVGFNTMMAEMVPARIRARYFTLRSRWINLTMVISMIVAGGVLELGRAHGSFMTYFAILFAVAAAMRTASLWRLTHHIEQVPMPPAHRDLSLRELVTRFRAGPGGRLLMYMLAMQLAIQIFTPYLNPYLFAQLNLKENFVAIALVNGAQILAKVLFMPTIGRLANRIGPMRLVTISGLAVVPLPLLWALNTSVPYLIVIQLISGAALATYEMATLLLLFEIIPNGERTSVMTRYTILSQTATMLGSFIGASVLQTLGVQSWAYLALFAVSAGFRLAAVPLLRRLIIPPRLPHPPLTVQLALHPAGGTMDDPVLPAISPPQKHGEFADHA